MQPEVETVSPLGTGVPYHDLDAADPLVVPASRTGIAHFRNRGSADYTLTVTVPESGADGLGARVVQIVVPPSAHRFVALSGRLAGATTSITFVPSGDLSKADVALISRHVLDQG